MGFEAKIEEIRRTAEAGRRAAETVRAVNAAEAWPAGDAGMPGARAVGKLEQVRQAWKQLQTSTADELTGHSESVDAAADRYAASDQDAADELSTRAPGKQPN